MSNFRVPYFVGNTIRRDHGIWPTITVTELYHAFGNVGEPNDLFLREVELQHPVGLTLEQLQLMTWRVREWTVAASTWTASTVALDEPIVDPDDFAVLNDAGSIPEFKFGIERLIPSSSLLRLVTDEQDLLAEWRNHPVVRDYIPPARVIPQWQTLRNWGVQGTPGEAGNGSPDSTLITDNFNFSDPVVLIGIPQSYNPAKFAPASGTVIGGTLALHMLNDYVIYNSAIQRFFPNLFFAFGGTLLPTTRTGRLGSVFNLLPAVPVVMPTDPDIVCGNLTINFGGLAPEVMVPIGFIQTGRPVSSPYTGLYPITLDPWSVQNTHTGSFNLNMSPSRWWPYKNSTGDPVYNETTGAQLVDPFS